MAGESGTGGGGAGLANVFGQWALQFFGDTSGLKVDLDKLELQGTKTATYMEKSFADGFNKGVGKAREGVGSLTEAVGGQMGRMTAFLTNPLTAIVTLGATFGLFAISAIKDAIDFERAFYRVRVVLGDTDKDMSGLRQRVLDLTPSMASAAEEANTLVNVLAVGFNEDQAIKITDTAAKLSRVAGIDLNSAARLLTDTLHAYGLEVSEVSRISNVFLDIMRTAGGPEALGELQSALGRVLPLASELKIPLEQVAAALGTMRQQGVSASRGAFALTTILSQVTNQAQKFRDAGVDIAKVAETEGIIGVLREIRRVSGGTVEDLKELGISGRTLNAVFALTGEKTALFQENLKRLGSTKLDDLVKNAKGIGASLIELKDAWDDFKVSIGSWAIPALAKLTRVAADTIKEVTGQKQKATGAEGPEFEPWMVFGPESPEGQAAQERLKLQEDIVEAGKRGKEAIAEEMGMYAAIADVVSHVTETEEERTQKSRQQRMREKEDIEVRSKAWADWLKIQEDGTTKQIQLDKQVAEARKAPELEVLTLDRRALDARFEFADRRRTDRLRAIEAELPLLNVLNIEEKRMHQQLTEERTKLNQEALNDKITKEKEITLIVQKENAARLKVEEATLAARKTTGDLTVAEELDRLRRVAGGQVGGKSEPERIQAGAEAFKLAREWADQLFEHQRTLGLKSLQDEIEFQKGKVAAAKEGTQRRITEEEKLFKKQEELRNKARSEAISILKEVQTRLEEKGITNASRADVEREMMAIQRENAQAGRETQRWVLGGGSGDLAQVIAGYEAMGKMETFQKSFGELGGFGGIFGGGAKLPMGPITEATGMGVSKQTLSDLQSIGRGDLVEQLLAKFGPEAGGAEAGGPFSGIPDSIQSAFGKAETILDESLTRMEGRVNESSSRIAQTIYGNIEDWFVRKLMFQEARG